MSRPKGKPTGKTATSALSGMILTGARVHDVVGTDHRAFA